MARTVETTICVERKGYEVELTVTGTVTPYRRARTSGPPENCSPAEGGDVEIESVVYEGFYRDGGLRGTRGRVWDTDRLTPDERAMAEEGLFEAADAEEEDPEPYDYRDEDYSDECRW